ncbi:hypothetical protein [Neptunicoccus cionae]|uniref:Uncharacterized protein n=1 Tax=Neptunicoccus cionae TaxID=2035344 RepID=A0A916QYB2_9RHOB|nr:hypothetical protein [Amylibacter cionae]GGA21159.1 hypothetical protein GCM10011498_22290 [Amylibacter cionae]
MKLIRRLTIPLAAATLAGCVTSEDPGDGGFFNGVAGASNGTYDGRVASRQAEVDSAQAENARLTAELARLRGEHSAIKSDLIAARAKAQAAGVRLNATQEGQVAAALRSDPARVESLSKAIADARRLTDSIARLAG